MCTECTKGLKKCSKSDKQSLFLEKGAYKNFPWIPGFQICSVTKNENPEMPDEFNVKFALMNLVTL